jgi:hypothetical protein
MPTMTTIPVRHTAGHALWGRLMVVIVCALCAASLPATASVSMSLSSETADVWTIQGDKGEKVGIAVPHNMHRFEKGYDRDFTSTVFTYERRFDLTPEIAAMPRRFIRFERANWRATVYVNDKKIGVHDGGFHAFEMDITDAVKPAGNRLKVVIEDYHCVFNREKKGKNVILGLLGRNHGWDYSRGLCDHVSLRGRNEVYLDEFYTWGIVRGDDSPEARDVKIINARTGIANATSEPVSVVVAYTYRNADRLEHVLESESIDVAPGATHRFDMSGDWSEPRLWSPDDPFRHDVTVSLVIDGETVDSESFKFGFRDFYARKTDWMPYTKDGEAVGDFWLNGKRIRMRNDSLLFGEWPTPRVFTERLWDGEGMEAVFLEAKANNIQAIRLHQGGWPKGVYEVADRVGILIVAESPFHGAHANGIEDYYFDFKNPKFWEMAKYQIREIVKDNRQFASIAVWGAENEVRFMARPKEIKTDPEFLANMASIFDVYAEADPAHDVWFEGEIDNLHPYNPRLFIINSHYTNAAGIVNRTETPNIAPWKKMGSDSQWFESAIRDQEYLRRSNERPFGVGEYFWASDPRQTAKSQLFGGFASNTKGPWNDARKMAYAKLAYYQTINMRRFPNIDFFGFFAAIMNPPRGHLEGLRPAYRPMVAYCRNHNDVFFEGAEIKREITVMNDSFDDSPVTLKTQARTAEGAVFFEREEAFDLPEAGVATTELAFTVPPRDAGDRFTFEYDLWQNGKPVDENERSYHIMAREPLSAPGPVYGLAGDERAARLLTDIQGQAVALRSVDELGDAPRGILLLGESKENTADSSAIREFLKEGGVVVYFATDSKALVPPEWLDVRIDFPRALNNRPFPYSIAFKDPDARGPVADALIDTDLVSQPVDSDEPYGDLRYWGGDNLIAEKCVRLVDDERFEPIVRATAGREPTMPNVLLAKVKQGKGRVWIVTLLCLEKRGASPPASKVLRTLLREAGQ